MTEVKLAIYDLSRGMARNLSAQFLGPDFAIDAIPHTGILVFGQEYFFGGGIQAEDPSAFRRNSNLIPIAIKSLGRTTVTQAEFEAWCQQQTQSGRYTATSYDLLQRNCNNFSHDAALQGLHLTRGVPEWILQVPQKFLGSPMGQMMRPMLENMQLSHGVPGSHSVGNGFASAAVPTNTAAPVRSPSTAPNPWASAPAALPTNTASLLPTTTALSTTLTKTKSTHLLLDTFTKPLLSSDVKMVPMCVTKLVHLTDREKQALETASSCLTQGDDLSDIIANETCQIFYHCLVNKTHTAWALLLLRAVVLRAPLSSIQECLTWIVDNLASLTNSTARTAAWLTVANACGSLKISNVLIDRLVDMASSDMSTAVPPVRQAVCSALYNIALGMEHYDELSDTAVSLLCMSLEGLDANSETDATCRLRRLMIVGRIVYPLKGNAIAQGLVTDLGYRSSIEQIAGAQNQTGDAEQSRKLASELLHII